MTRLPCQIDIPFLQNIEASGKETLAVINQMQADGVIGKYATGGAVGATLYLEPRLRSMWIYSFRSLPSLPIHSLTCWRAAVAPTQRTS